MSHSKKNDAPSSQGYSPLIQESKSTQAMDDEIVARYEAENPWGMSILVDIYFCDPKLIRNREKIETFLIELVKFIKMIRYGEPLIHDFGKNPRVSGFSALQLIETSSIAAHFANSSNSAHIDVFSCKPFRPHDTARFCQEYFLAKEMTVSPAYFRF